MAANKQKRGKPLKAKSVPVLLDEASQQDEIEHTGIVDLGDHDE